MSNSLPPEAKVLDYFKQGFSAKDIASKTGCSLAYVEDDIKAFATRIESLSDHSIDRIGKMSPSCIIRIEAISSIAASRIREAAIGRHARSKSRSAEAYKRRLEGDDFRL